MIFFVGEVQGQGRAGQDAARAPEGMTRRDEVVVRVCRQQRRHRADHLVVEPVRKDGRVEAGVDVPGLVGDGSMLGTQGRQQQVGVEHDVPHAVGAGVHDADVVVRVGGHDGDFRDLVFIKGVRRDADRDVPLLGLPETSDVDRVGRQLRKVQGDLHRRERHRVVGDGPRGGVRVRARQEEEKRGVHVQ